MELLWRILWWLYAFVFLVLFLSATVHHHLGLRKHYINFLLRLFAFGQERVERKRLLRPHNEADESESSLDEQDRPLISADHPRALGIKEDIKGFQLDNVLEYISAGMGAIMEDNLTKSFEPEQLPAWNLLSRTNDRAYEFVSFRLTVCWLIGFLVRYFLLFPLRIVILLLGVLLFWTCMVAIGMFPAGSFKRWLNEKLLVFCFDFIAGSLSLVATFHHEENAPKGGIAVANHTSPIDSMVLATHNCYDMVGQKHDGFLNIFMSALSRASTHIWFERSDAKDRSLVVKRLQEHVNDVSLPPILIYPEGVCVNNTSVMQFKKGAFEIDSVIHPIAIRFDARFGDAFWWQDKFFHYILYMMTSWAIVCNVWYLPPMKKKSGESAIAFADRVKAKIAHQGGMIDLTWDGFLKCNPVKAEWKKRQQEEFAKHLQTEKELITAEPVKDKEE
ncbi:glycerol-3-phosphate acyltransferase 4-like [Homarus americanus]|uniref:Glycerol-3-phosphate acyltransferase 4-like 1 n=1 Tax=Homarus americanus TaxID=6706 RepID=A0A8J5T1U8_HOMAM|nr:glycerol-3-phosphate acyltransferase 4-like [Homarus americanus]XP_042216380.1 glycerol-3-phosphate acyltransferase 4-like [Homarus americanus]KAG7171839.1 Glycerol-3-phosphate acyltransferase 4-like 1 [Homarus americanus]